MESLFRGAQALPITRKTFLDLPPELRWRIYEEAAKSISIQVNDRFSPVRFSTALPLVSRQVRAESLPVIYAIGPINAVVINWAFSGLLTFEERLSEAELRSIQENPVRKVLIIKTGSASSGIPELQNWLRRFADPRADALFVRWEYRARPHEWSVMSYWLQIMLEQCNDTLQRPELERMYEGMQRTGQELEAGR